MKTKYPSMVQFCDVDATGGQLFGFELREKEFEKTLNKVSNDSYITEHTNYEVFKNIKPSAAIVA